MRAIVVVVVAVASLLGLGWYFANSQTGHSAAAPAVLTQSLAPASRPSVDQAAFQKPNEKIDFQSGVHATSKHPSKNAGREFQMPADENEVVGKYVHRQMVYPKGRSAEKRVPMDDDLLVMEGRSEDRLSATR